VVSSSSETEMEMPWISDDDDGMVGARDGKGLASPVG
jgi:hypothetical protein